MAELMPLLMPVIGQISRCAHVINRILRMRCLGVQWPDPPEEYPSCQV